MTKPETNALRVAFEGFFDKVDAARTGGNDDPSVSSYLAGIVQNTADRSGHGARGNSLREILQSVQQEHLPEEEPVVDDAALTAELDKVGDEEMPHDFYAD